MPLPLGTRDPASNPLHRNQILIEIFDLNSQSHQRSQVIESMFQKLVLSKQGFQKIFLFSELHSWEASNFLNIGRVCHKTLYSSTEKWEQYSLL